MWLIVLLILIILFEGYTGPHPFRDPWRMWAWQSCDDKDSRCARWAAGYECRRNPVWMFENCPNACGVCDMTEKEKAMAIVDSVTYDKRKELVTSADFAGETQCSQWKSNGWCKEHPYFMSQNCAETCS